MAEVQPMHSKELEDALFKYKEEEEWREKMASSHEEKHAHHENSITAIAELLRITDDPNDPEKYAARKRIINRLA